MIRTISEFVIAKETKSFMKRCCSGKAFNPRNLKNKITVVGVPFGKGQNDGTKETGLIEAPDCLRATNFIQDLEFLGIDIIDQGNIQYEPLTDVSMDNMHNVNHFGPCIKKVNDVVQDVLKSSRTCLVLGGDHSIMTGTLNAHINVAGPEDVAVVYVDAHADVNTPKSSPSGNIHGMAVAFLANEAKSLLPKKGIPGLEFLTPCFPLSNLAYIGLRSVDPGELSFITEHDVPIYPMNVVQELGIRDVLSKALKKIDPNNNKSIHLSFDIDSLDVLEAPCTTSPVRGGLTLREGIEIAETIHKTERLSVVDFVEVNPSVGTEIQKETTFQAARTLLLAIGGYTRVNCFSRK